MADNESDNGSDAGSDDEGSPGFDPTKDLDKLTDKERKKWDKRLDQWRIFIDFIFRQLAICTYKFNMFEREELPQFMIAMEKAEMLRGQKKLKKSESPNITSYKVMKECTELLNQQKFVAESNRIKAFMNIAGRARGIATIAGGFFRAMKKAKLRGIDKIKYYLDFWKGFTVRSFDYSGLAFRNANPETFNALERKYLVWPTTVKTALSLSQKFLKVTSESTGLDLITPDSNSMKKYLEAPEFVLASHIEDQLMERVSMEGKSFLSGLGTSLGPGIQNPSPEGGRKYEVPKVDDVDPELLKPIPDDGVLLNLPEDPPKEKKGKKGKKGKKSGKKGGRPSSHKPKKKKKKK